MISKNLITSLLIMFAFIFTGMPEALAKAKVAHKKSHAEVSKKKKVLAKANKKNKRDVASLKKDKKKHKSKKKKKKSHA